MSFAFIELLTMPKNAFQESSKMPKEVFKESQKNVNKSQVKKRDELIHKENKLEVGGIQVHPGHMAAMQGAAIKVKNFTKKLFFPQDSPSPPWVNWATL